MALYSVCAVIDLPQLNICVTAPLVGPCATALMADRAQPATERVLAGRGVYAGDQLEARLVKIITTRRTPIGGGKLNDEVIAEGVEL